MNFNARTTEIERKNRCAVALNVIRLFDSWHCCCECLIFDFFVKRAFKYSSSQNQYRPGWRESQRTRSTKAAQIFKSQLKMLLNQISVDTALTLSIYWLRLSVKCSRNMKHSQAVSLRASLICFGFHFDLHIRSFTIANGNDVERSHEHTKHIEHTESTRKANPIRIGHFFSRRIRICRVSTVSSAWACMLIQIYCVQFWPLLNRWSFKCHTIRHDNAIHQLLVLHIAYQTDGGKTLTEFFCFGHSTLGIRICGKTSSNWKYWFMGNGIFVFTHITHQLNLSSSKHKHYLHWDSIRLINKKFN